MKPTVTVFIPCYNEEFTIVRLLDALATQSYPQENIDILLVDGMSTDKTRRIVEDYLAERTLKLKILDNPRRIIPAALNIGANAATGEVLIRMDAHSVPNPNYVELCVENLIAGKGDNVGGKWNIQAAQTSYTAKSIAIAAAHPLGSGGASYRSGDEAKTVDTVPFGAFYKKTYIANGPFDETLLANEDYEWNARLIKNGGKVWFDPAIECIYFSRSSLSGLRKQYFNYGYWKLKMLQRYPDTLRLRQLIPPLACLILLGSLILALIFLGLGKLLIASAVFSIIALYVTLLYAVLMFTRPNKLSLIPGITLSVIIMQLSWGAGFLFSFVKRSPSY